MIEIKKTILPTSVKWFINSQPCIRHIKTMPYTFVVNNKNYTQSVLCLKQKPVIIFSGCFILSACTISQMQLYFTVGFFFLNSLVIIPIIFKVYNTV